MNTQEHRKYELSTDEFARNNGVKAQTVRVRLCRFGSYYGITPLKLANRKTLWPNVQVQA